MVGGCQLSAVAGKPQWMKDRNLILARANRSASGFLQEDVVSIHLDWNSGQLWSVLPNELCLALPVKFSNNSKWNIGNLKSIGLCPDAVSEKFDSDF